MKLKGLYKTAISHAEQEEELLRKALQKITEIRNIKSERRIQVCNHIRDFIISHADICILGKIIWQ